MTTAHITLAMIIPDECIKAIAEFPRVLQDLIQAELAAGNSIVEIGPGHPAPMNGARLMLAKPLLSRPRTSDEHINFYARNSSAYSAEITDAERTFFIVEAPLPPPTKADMDAIRAELEARERASNAAGWDH